MVRVSWKSQTGDLISVESGDGPGQFSSGGDPELIKQHLQSKKAISERDIVSTLFSSYSGPMPNQELIATAQSYSSEKETDVKTTIAFLEPATLEGRLSRIECTNCNYCPDSGSSWNVQDRSGEEYEYRDWCCPKCDLVVHTDVQE